MQEPVEEVVKNPMGISITTWLVVCGFAILGGLVKWFNDFKESNGWTRKQIAVTLAAQIFTSGFVGLVTFLACHYFNVNELLSAVFVGISGHMGAEAINVFKAGFSSFFGRAFANVPAQPKEGGSATPSNKDGV